MNERWQGFQLHLSPDSIHTDRYEVKFWPAAQMTLRGPIGRAKETMVTVEDQGELRVIAFSPPPRPYANLDRRDYERKALELVRQHLGS